MPPHNKTSATAGCRFCGESLERTFVDLGMSPLCEGYVSADHLNNMEPFYPLHVYVCENCFLVQLQEYVSPDDIFTEYAYYSSYSDSWLEHVKNYTDMIVDRLKLDEQSRVIELASNDGYLLQYFVQRGIPCLGIEPAANIAPEAERKGVPTVIKFFGQRTANEIVADYGKADLVIGNNVLAQVPDINDFVSGTRAILKARGVVTMEFPHLMQLMDQNQFDTIYHEHFSYFSLLTVERIFSTHRLKVFDVEELSTHGGSLRIYACHSEDDSRAVGEAVLEMARREKDAAFDSLECYSTFSEQVKETKRKLLTFLITAKREGKAIVGYGAPGKGNTLLNYCGIRTDFVDFTVDRNIYKQGKYLPGTHIPIFGPEKIAEAKPDYLLILPWNFKEEIMAQMASIREWGGRFVVPIPEVTIYE